MTWKAYRSRNRCKLVDDGDDEICELNFVLETGRQREREKNLLIESAERFFAPRSSHVIVHELKLNTRNRTNERTS
jgi:hypothetical protein